MGKEAKATEKTAFNIKLEYEAAANIKIIKEVRTRSRIWGSRRPKIWSRKSQFFF